MVDYWANLRALLHRTQRTSDKALAACYLVGLMVTNVTIHREESEVALNG